MIVEFVQKTRDPFLNIKFDPVGLTAPARRRLVDQETEVDEHFVQLGASYVCIDDGMQIPADERF